MTCEFEHIGQSPNRSCLRCGTENPFVSSSCGCCGASLGLRQHSKYGVPNLDSSSDMAPVFTGPNSYAPWAPGTAAGASTASFAPSNSAYTTSLPDWDIPTAKATKSSWRVAVPVTAALMFGIFAGRAYKNLQLPQPQGIIRLGDDLRHRSAGRSSAPPTNRATRSRGWLLDHIGGGKHSPFYWFWRGFYSQPDKTQTAGSPPSSYRKALRMQQEWERKHGYPTLIRNGDS